MGKDPTIKDYCAHLDASSMTGEWKPAGTWHRVHGDCKSNTRGHFTMATMTSTAHPVKYKVKIMEHGTTVSEHDWPHEPSYTEIVSYFQGHHK